MVLPGAATAATATVVLFARIGFLTVKSFLKPVVVQLKDSLIEHKTASAFLSKVGQAKHQIGTRVTLAFNLKMLKKDPLTVGSNLLDVKDTGILGILRAKVEPLDEKEARVQGADAVSDLAVCGVGVLSLVVYSLWSIHQEKKGREKEHATEKRFTEQIEATRALMQQQMDRQSETIRGLETLVRQHAEIIEMQKKDMQKMRKWSIF
jgi:hypothetical protein